MAPETSNEFQHTQVSLCAILSRSCVVYRGSFFLLMGLAALGYSLLGLASVLLWSWSPAQTWGGLTVMIIALFVRPWADAAIIIAASNGHLGRSVTLRECFVRVKGSYWQFVMISVQYSLIFLAGLLLLAVPGIYWGTILCLAPVVVLLEGRRQPSPFRRSLELVRGSFWQVLCVGLLLLLIMRGRQLVGAHFRITDQGSAHLWLGVSGLLLWPFVLTVRTVLYHNLKQNKPSAPTAEPSEPGRRRGRGCLLGLFSALGLTVVALFLMAFWIAWGPVPIRRLAAGLMSQSRMVLPGGVQLARPDGWWAYRRPGYRRAYGLWKPDNRTVKRLTVWWLPLRELNADTRGASLTDPRLARGVHELGIERLRTASKSDKAYGLESVASVVLSGREWAEATFSCADQTDRAPGRWTIKHVYTLCPDQAIVFTFAYKVPEHISAQDAITLEEEERHVRAIIASVQFL